MELDDDVEEPDGFTEDRFVGWIYQKIHVVELNFNWFSLFLCVSGSTELFVCKHETIPAKEQLGFSSFFHFFTSTFLFFAASSKASFTHYSACLTLSPLLLVDVLTPFDFWEHLIFCFISEPFFFFFCIHAPSSIVHMHHFPRGHLVDAPVFIKDEWPTITQAGGFPTYDVQTTPAAVKTD